MFVVEDFEVNVVVVGGSIISTRALRFANFDWSTRSASVDMLRLVRLDAATFSANCCVSTSLGSTSSFELTIKSNDYNSYVTS